MMMDFKQVENRDYDSVFNWPSKSNVSGKTDKQKREQVEKYRKIICNKLMGASRLVFFIGLSCTGKTTIMNFYNGRENWSVTKWDRDNIMDMLFDQRYVPKFYGDIKSFEDEVFPKLFERNQHQVLIEGWFRTKQERSRVLNYMPENLGRTCAIVLDGPPDRIAERCIKEGALDKPDSEVKNFIKTRHNNYQWPTYDEGFDMIYYLNTFGKIGEDYLDRAFT